MRFNRSRLTFSRQLADQKELGPLRLALTWALGKNENSRNPTKPSALFSEIHTMLNINGLLHRGHQS